MAPAAEGWGRWFRQIEVVAEDGQVLMDGIDGRPLLMLNRVEQGRMALIASDQTWLWDRGFEGGGPQLELLRRLAHWMMGEPELQEETLTATAEGQRLSITRRSLGEEVGDIIVTAPDGTETALAVTEEAPGEYRAEWDAPEIGLYRLREGDLTSVGRCPVHKPRANMKAPLRQAPGWTD